MRCPDCNSGWSSVYRTMKVSNKIRRYRTCNHCGRNFVSSETTDPPKKDKDNDFYVISDDEDN